MKRTPLKRKTPLRARKSWRLDGTKARPVTAQPKPRKPLRPRSRKNKKRPRNLPYMRWIKTLPCVVCRKLGSEAAHTGRRGLGQKAPDEQCIPLCPRHHRDYPDALDIAGPRRFQVLHGVDISVVVAGLQARWVAMGQQLVTLGHVEDMSTSSRLDRA